MVVDVQSWLTSICSIVLSVCLAIVDARIIVTEGIFGPFFPHLGYSGLVDSPGFG